MSPTHLHQKLIKACENGNIDEVKYCLDFGVDPNFNIKGPVNALDRAIENNNRHIVDLLLDHGAFVKEFVLQKAIEKDKAYLSILVPNFPDCTDKSLLMGVLLAAINIDDLSLAKQAIAQGAQASTIYLYAIRDIKSTNIFQLLLENGFNIHAENNKALTELLGSSEIGYMKSWREEKDSLLSFIASYYLEKVEHIEKFVSLYPPDKLRIFRLGLDSNNLNMMKFAFLIGADKNEALNSALYRYYDQNHKSEKVDYDIIEYILSSNIKFKNITISNAVRFKYIDLLDSLSSLADLEYGYEMACKYKNDDLCDYFINRGLSKELQSFVKMKVSAMQGDLKGLRKAVNEGANLDDLDKSIIVKIINENHLEALKFIYDSGLVLELSLNESLDDAIRYHGAYESVSYLIEIGFDITFVKKLPLAYKKSYPLMNNMWEKKFTDIFDYTIYLTKEVYPTLEGKKKDELLKIIAELSSLPYVIQRSKEQSLEK